MAAITLSNATIAASAPSGSVIGTFNVSGLRVLQTDPSVNYFSISGKNLIGKWTSPPTPAVYKVWVYVVNLQPTAFNITITAAAAKPTPTSVTLTPASVSLPDNSASGILLSKIAVKMNDNSTFAGTLTLPQNALVVVSGSSMVLKRALVAGDDGAHQYTVTATQNGASASATLQLTVTAVAPSAITLAASPTTVASGDMVTASWSGATNGTSTDWIAVFAAGASNNAYQSWKYTGGAATGSLQLAVPSAAGQYELRYLYMDGYTSLATSSAITVNAPARTLVLSLSNQPQIPDNSPSGTLVSTATVQYSDGTQPASVTLTSSDTTFIKVQGMQLVLARALTAADDGTHPVTITASDGLSVHASASLFG